MDRVNLHRDRHEYNNSRNWDSYRRPERPEDIERRRRERRKRQMDEDFENYMLLNDDYTVKNPCKYQNSRDHPDPESEKRRKYIMYASIIAIIIGIGSVIVYYTVFKTSSKDDDDNDIHREAFSEIEMREKEKINTRQLDERKIRKEIEEKIRNEMLQKTKMQEMMQKHGNTVPPINQVPSQSTHGSALPPDAPADHY